MGLMGAIALRTSCHRHNMQMTLIGDERETSVRRHAYRVVGTTSDGVKILASVAKSTHFTSKQIRATIRDIKRNSLHRS